MKQILTLLLSLLSLKHLKSDYGYYDSYNGKNVGSSYNQTSNMPKIYAKTKILCLSYCNELLSCQIVVYNQSNTQSFNCFLYENPLNFSADVVNSTGTTLFKKIFASINESCLKIDCDYNSGLVCDNTFKCSCTNDSYYWSTIQRSCVYKCPTLEWIYNFSRCFIFTNIRNLTWILSDTYCKSIGARLPILHSLAEEGFLYSFINSLNYADRASIPVNAVCKNSTMCTLRQYEWTDGRVIPYPDNSWWTVDQPNGDVCVFYYYQFAGDHFGLQDYFCDKFDIWMPKCITTCETDIDTSR